MSKKPLAIRFGQLIRMSRQQAHLSQEDFADLCQLHRTYVGSIERGEKNITLETAFKLAKALNISLTELIAQLEGTDDPG